MRIIILHTRDAKAPKGKLADIELHFSAGILNGFKWVGFSLWKSKFDDGNGFNVLFPARSYTSAAGEKKYFSLFRTIDPDNDKAEEALRDAIVAEYKKSLAE